MNPQNLHAHEDRLLDFAYGELPTPEARVVEAHLQGCARCAQALRDIRGVRATMSQLSVEPAPDAGLESLLAYAHQAARRAAAGPEPRPSRWRRWLLPVVGLASVSTFGILTLQARNPELTRPDLSQASVERKKEAAPAAALPAAPPPAASAEQAAPKAPGEAPQGQALALKDAPAPESKGAGVQAQRDSDWVNAGSGGGLDARIDREPPSKAKRDVSRTRTELPRDRAGASVEMKPAPSAKPVPANRAERDEVMALAEKREAPSPKKPKYMGDSLRVGGTAPSMRADADDEAADGLTAPEEEAMPEAVLAGATPALDAPAAAPMAEEAAPPPPSAQVASAPLAARPAPATAGIGSVAGSRASSGPSSADLDSLSNSDKELARKKSQRPGSASAAPSAPAASPQRVASREPAPSVAELSRRARSANLEGQRALEASLLRSALNAGATGAERWELLSRLCDAELALGRQAAGVEACKQVLREAPGSSSVARSARSRLAREGASADEDGPSKAAQPAR
jgi:hypothetical protein